MTAQKYAGKVVIVTGASSGIGAATAAAFAAQGARVAMSAPASQMAALQSMADKFASSGQTCSVFAVDVTDGGQVAAMVDQVVAQWSGIDVLVNNAGVGYHGPFESMSLDDFDKVVQINLLGAARCLYAVVPVMMRQRSGQIINIASAHSRRAHPRYAAYSASKYALRALSDTLRVELAPHGVRVLTFCPPYTESRFFDNVLHTVGRIKPQRAGATPESVADAIINAATQGKREVIVTLRERVLDWGNRCAPALIDSLIARRYESKLKSQI
jgi:short-subunit dehydrogenase